MSVTKDRCVRVRVFYRGVDVWAKNDKPQKQMLYTDGTKFFVPFKFHKVECELVDGETVSLVGKGGMSLPRNAHRDGTIRAVRQSELPDTTTRSNGTTANEVADIDGVFDVIDTAIDGGEDDVAAIIKLASKLRFAADGKSASAFMTTPKAIRRRKAA